jgi:hypothetical protein
MKNVAQFQFDQPNPFLAVICSSIAVLLVTLVVVMLR